MAQFHQNLHVYLCQDHYILKYLNILKSSKYVAVFFDLI